MILAETQEGQADGKPRLRWRDLLKLPQTWGTIISKALPIPFGSSSRTGFPIYLVAKGISLKSGLVAVWIPFLAADLGNFFGGGVSGYLIRRGWPLGVARKALVVFGGVGVTLLIPTIFNGESVPDHAAFRARHLFLRFLFDDRKRAAYRSL